jgi:hypothetical protein
MEPVGWGVGMGLVFSGRKSFGLGRERALCAMAARKVISQKCEALSDCLQEQKGQIGYLVIS